MVTASTYSKLWHRISPLLLSLSWLFGMTLGCISCQKCQEQSVAMIHQNVSAIPSMVGAGSVVFLPVLLSAFAVSICEPCLLLVISTFKAFSFSFCAWGVCLAFGQSSWLVLFLFLFSDICLIPALYFYWLRHIRQGSSSGWSNGLLLVYALLIFIADYWVVGPFLRIILE